MHQLTIAGKAYRSRLLVGTGKYKDFAETRAAIDASGAEIVTVAVRRVNIGQDASQPSLLDAVPPAQFTILPNTAGCYTADDAVRTLRLAREHGLEGRVDFIDGGNLAALCRASQGMVVNNSSAALSSLGFHTPVKVMGDAFFDFEGLTDQKPLDDFWRAPEAPDSDLFTRFRAHVIAQSQVNGNFHEPHAILPTARGVADVFERAGR